MICAVVHQAITWANADRDLCTVTSLSHVLLASASQVLIPVAPFTNMV